jgi:hypothetical protein
MKIDIINCENCNHGKYAYSFRRDEYLYKCKLELVGSFIDKRISCGAWERKP